MKQAVACSAKLTRWDDAAGRLEAYISHNPDSLIEVVGQRLLAGLYLSVPHYGSVRDGRFLRGDSGQGERRDTEESDGREAIGRLERATWPHGSRRPCRPARPRATAGRYDGANRDVVTEEETRRWDTATDAEERLLTTVVLPEEGQYHVAFHARDAWDQEVEGNAVSWVQGPRFDGRAYRSNELELVPDQRSYRVGKTAHLLIHPAGDNARVTFGHPDPDRGLNAVRFVDVPGARWSSTYPSTRAWSQTRRSRRPSCTTVACTRNCANSSCPRKRSCSTPRCRTDKDVYGPGETGLVHVKATDKAGNPAVDQVALIAFDKAVTYIQPEASMEPGSIFYGRKSYYQAEADSSFDQGFAAAGATNGTEDHPNRIHVPEGWDGA